MLYPLEGDIREVSQRDILEGCDKTQKETWHSETKFLCWPQTTNVLDGTSFIIQEHPERSSEFGDERKKKGDVDFVRNHLSKSKEGGVNHHEGQVLSWEEMKLGCTVHHIDNVNHAPVLQKNIVNNFNFYKINLQGPNCVHEKMQKWLLFHK